MEKAFARIATCPHCGVLSRHECVKREQAGWGYVTRGETPENGSTRPTCELYHYIYRCPGCTRDTYLLAREPQASQAYYQTTFPALVGNASYPQEIVFQWPVGSLPMHASVPERVAKAASEADKCAAVAAFNACGTMVRRAIDALCLDKKADGKDLYERLRHLKDTHQITSNLWEWAEDLRILGRCGAHPEWEDLSGDDAMHGVRFLQDIVKYVYVLPSETQARRLKETKKRGTS